VMPDAPEYLRWVTRSRGDGDLRAYLPGSVCEIVESISDYEGTPKVLDRHAVDRVATLYFTEKATMAGQDGPARPVTSIRARTEADPVGPNTLRAVSF
jgi:hypothetical protein